LNHLHITAEPGFRSRDGSVFQVDVAVTRTAGRSASLAMEFRIRRGDTTVCLADAEFGWVSPAAYRRLRGRHLTIGWGDWPLPRPADPQLVGRAEENDVLLAAGGDGLRWQLRNDVTNTLLFDHPVDHVPGLVLIDAAQQAAHAAASPTRIELTDIAITYERYVELDEPCWIESHSLPALLPLWFTVVVVGRQRGQVAFRARLRALRSQA
jgi:hypothetical protein